MKLSKAPSLLNNEMTLNQTDENISNSSFQFSEEVRIHIISLLLDGKKPDQIILEWDLDCRAPDRSTIYRLKRKVKYTGTVKNKVRKQTKFSIINELSIQLVENELVNNDELSIRELSDLTKISKSSVHRILVLMEFHYYKFQFVQQLENCDIEKRYIFCSQFYRLHFNTRMRIWFSDECSFPCNGTVNTKNSGYYSNENEHRKIEVLRNRATVNVWAAICGEGKIVYDDFYGTQNAEKYVSRLKKVFPQMELKSHIFMQDGASIHTVGLILEFLRTTFKKRWIGIGSPWIEFPPYSPDLTPCDFFLWGYLKEKVYIRSPDSKKIWRQ